MLERVLDLLVAGSGIGAIALLASRREGWRNWGGVVGILGQPFWIQVGVQVGLQQGRWGHLVVSSVITILYAKSAWHGMNAFFRRKPVQGGRL